MFTIFKTEAETVENLNEKTDPIVIKKFIIEKQKKAEEILNNSEELVLGSSQEYFEKTYDLGDYCWIKIEIEDKRIPSFLERVKEVVIPSSYAFSQSGHKTGWQKYGNYSYTGRATANYGVAMGQYMLEVNYNVSANGIKVTDETASSIDETLLSISTQKCITTDNIATKPGASDCNSYAIFKTTYGYSPVVWTRNHKLQVNLKYLDKDATNKELHITREWSIAPYNP